MSYYYDRADLPRLLFLQQVTALLIEGKTAKFEVIFDEKLREQRSVHEST